VATRDPWRTTYRSTISVTRLPVTGSGRLAVVYEALMAGPVASAIAFDGVKEREGWECLSVCSWAATEAVVGTAPGPTSTCTRLFLSEKDTFPPVPLCVQPSGYFIDHPADASVKTRKTWLSGMSPVAAECASAERAPAAPDVEAGAEEAPPELLGADEAVDAEELLEEPQPDAPSPATRLSAASADGIFGLQGMPARVARGSDYLLKAG